MTKEKKNVKPSVEVPVLSTPVADVPEPAQPIQMPAPRLADIDKMALDLAKERRQTALAEAQTALAFKYVVLQLYMKYGLTDADAISEDGSIVKNGALPQAK
jgi:hypothetical protein